MKSQVLHTVWFHISCEASGEFWNWSLLRVKGLRVFLFKVRHAMFVPSSSDSDGASRRDFTVVRVFKKPVYICDFWCDFWCDFAYKTRLTLLARMLFSRRSIAWIAKKVTTYHLKTPFISISANLAVFCHCVTRLKTRAGLAGVDFLRKIACVNGS